MAEWNDGLLSGKIREQQRDMVHFWAYCLIAISVFFIVLCAALVVGMVVYKPQGIALWIPVVVLSLYGGVLFYAQSTHLKVLDKMTIEDKEHWNRVYGPVYGCDFDEFDRRMYSNGKRRGD